MTKKTGSDNTKAGRSKLVYNRKGNLSTTPGKLQKPPNASFGTAAKIAKTSTKKSD